MLGTVSDAGTSQRKNLGSKGCKQPILCTMRFEWSHTLWGEWWGNR